MRRIVGLILPTEIRKFLKRYKEFIGINCCYLCEEGEQKLGKLLSYSKKLIEFYAMKEALIYWYELCHESNYYR